MTCSYKHITGAKCDCSLSKPCETVTTVTTGDGVLIVADLPHQWPDNKVHCY